MDKSQDAYRTISEVADDLDLPQHVLRFWETRFAQIKPLKRGGGRRYYRPEDVDLLRGIRVLLYAEGYTIRGVQRIIRESGVKAIQALGRGEGPIPPQKPGGPEVVGREDEAGRFEQEIERAAAARVASPERTAPREEPSFRAAPARLEPPAAPRMAPPTPARAEPPSFVPAPVRPAAATPAFSPPPPVEIPPRRVEPPSFAPAPAPAPAAEARPFAFRAPPEPIEPRPEPVLARPPEPPPRPAPEPKPATLGGLAALSRDDIQRLQATLYELGEAQKRLSDALGR